MTNERKFKEVEGNSNMWTPDKEGEILEGVIRELKDGKYGVQAIIVSEDGVEHITPSHKVLQNRIDDCSIGDFVRITFIKEELPTIKGNKPTKIYKVEVEVDNETEVKE